MVNPNQENAEQHNEMGPTEEALGRGLWHKQPSSRLRDYVMHTVTRLSPSNCLQTSQRLPGISYPIAQYVNCSSILENHRKFLEANTVNKDPIHDAKASINQCW